MSENNNIRIVFLATIFLMAQLFFTVLSTHHALMDMPPTCPVCAVAGDYENAVIPVAIEIPAGDTGHVFLAHISISTPRFKSAFQPRAPPSS